MSNNIFYLKKYFFQECLCVVILFTSCKKFVDIPAPVTGTSAQNVYTTNATAAAVLTGVYTNMSRDNYSAIMSFVPGLLADELGLFAINSAEYYFCYTNSLTPDLFLINFWGNAYYKIFVANAALEGLTQSPSLTQSVKDQLLGEAKFLRAFMYFYLVNYYGDVPLALSTDYKINTSLPRTASAKIYEQIFLDLQEATELLNNNYVEADAMSSNNTTGRVRPNKAAAQALLARAYLYNGNYAAAEVTASAVIDNDDLYELLPLNDAFLKNNREAIWQLQVIGVGYGANTEEGRRFVMPETGPNNTYPFYLSDTLINSFEPADQRRYNWTRSVTTGARTYYCPYKYKIGDGLTVSAEYPTLLRLAEQYLIRAEAKILQNKVDEGIADLNALRTRATDQSAPLQDQLPQLPQGMNQQDAVKAVEHERQVELFTELGHRWLDLKRTGRANDILSVIKGNNWQSTDQLFPIPQYDMSKNPSLSGQQNEGY